MPVAKLKNVAPPSVEVSGLPESLDELYPALCRIQGLAKKEGNHKQIEAIAGRLLQLLRDDAAGEVAA